MKALRKTRGYPGNRRSVLPVAAGIASASPHEVTLVEETIDNGFLEHAPDRSVGDAVLGAGAMTNQGPEEYEDEPLHREKEDRWLH